MCITLWIYVILADLVYRTSLPTQLDMKSCNRDPNSFFESGCKYFYINWNSYWKVAWGEWRLIHQPLEFSWGTVIFFTSKFDSDQQVACCPLVKLCWSIILGEKRNLHLESYGKYEQTLQPFVNLWIRIGFVWCLCIGYLIILFNYFTVKILIIYLYVVMNYYFSIWF